MSPGEINRVLEALDVLCNASVDLLRSHRTELLAAVQKLQSLIEDQSTAIVVVTRREASSPSTDDPGRPAPSSSHHSSPNPPNNNDSLPFSLNSKDPLGPSPGQHTTCQAPPHAHPLPPAPPSSTKRFVRKTNEGLERIEKYLSKVCRKGVTSEPVWKYDDPRVVDIQIAGGSKSSPDTKFRRGLSQRSLAIEFNDWESNTYGTSILKERATNPSVEPSRKLGHITNFLKANTNRFRNLVAARTGIEHGLKLLVSETLLGGIGYSAILIFRYTKFRAVKYAEFNELKDEIKRSNSIKELAEQKADWFGQCQSMYNAWYKKTIGLNKLQSPLRAGIKRRRLDCSSSQPKPLTAREPNDSNQHMNGASLTSGAGVEALASPGRQTQATPASISNITATSPLQQTHSHQDEQTQQSSPSRMPSSRHLTQSNSPHPSGYKVSSGGNNRSGMAMDDAAQQSFTEPVSFSQSDASKDGPIPESDNFAGTAPGLHFEDGFSTGSVSSFLTHSEAVGGLAGVAYSHLDTGSANYFTTYIEPTSGPHLDTGSANYFTTYTEPTSGPHVDTGSANYFTTYTEPGGVFTAF